MTSLRYIPASVFHPTDFSAESEVAFSNALGLALRAKAELRIMHIDPTPNERRWKSFPQVRETLARWGALPNDSPRSAVGQLGMRVTKIHAIKRNPSASMIRYLSEHPADWVVLATHQRDGLARWLYHAVAEPVARHSRAISLFIPPKTEGLVSPKDGTVRLRQIVIPVDQKPHPQRAIKAAMTLADILRITDAVFTLVHVGSEREMPAFNIPVRPGWTTTSAFRKGNVVGQLLRVANQCSADLMVMATQGHDGFLDALRGSTTERVLREAPCPVLAVPVN